MGFTNYILYCKTEVEISRLANVKVIDEANGVINYLFSSLNYNGPFLSILSSDCVDTNKSKYSKRSDFA